jgi:hypothetical protein
MCAPVNVRQARRAFVAQACILLLLSASQFIKLIIYRRYQEGDDPGQLDRLNFDRAIGEIFLFKGHRHMLLLGGFKDMCAEINRKRFFLSHGRGIASKHFRG